MKPASSSSPENQSAIDETAAHWLAQRDAGWSPADAEAFEQWLQTDPRHEQAVVRLEHTRQLLARLPESPAAADLWREVEELTRPPRRVVRFPAWLRGLAAAAAIALLLAAAWRIAPRSSNFTGSYLTANDQTQQLVLPDGSQLRLSPASALDVRYSRGERLINLPRGEAYFDVIRDPQRPLLVTAGNVSVRAVGTAFSVRRDATDAIEVVVTEGKVQVERNPASLVTASTPPQLLLSAGERLRWDPQRSGGLPSVTRAVPESELAESSASSRRLQFTDTPLAKAVAEFNRHNRVQLEIADPVLAQRAIEGTFDAAGAESFAELLAKDGDIRIERPSPDRIILRLAR